MFLNNPTNVRVALYIRVSTDEQAINGTSIESQKEALLNYINQRNLITKNTFILDQEKHIYIDAGFSWAKADRPAFQKMLEWVRNKEFDSVLVYKIDRFFRNTIGLLEYIQLLSDYEVWFNSITQPIDTSGPFGKAVLTMLWAIAELERDLIRERTTIGRFQKSKQWYFVGGSSCKYGFDTIDDWKWKKLVIHQEEAKIVQKIFEMYTKDKRSISYIAEYLTNQKIPTKYDSKHKWKEKYKKKVEFFWHPSTIRNILSDTMYIGKYYYWKTYEKKDPVTGKMKICERKKWDPLLIELECEKILTDEAVFYQAQELLKKNKLILNNENPHLFTGLIQCETCWKNYVWYRSSKWTIHYKCGGSVKWKTPVQHKCHNPEVSQNFLIDIIWNQIEKVFENPNKMLAMYYNLWHEHSTKLNEYNNDLINIESSINQEIEILSRTYDDFYKEANDIAKKILETKIIKAKEKVDSLLGMKNDLSEKIKKLQELKWNTIEFDALINKFKESITAIKSHDKKLELIKLFTNKIFVTEKWWVKIEMKLENFEENEELPRKVWLNKEEQEIQGGKKIWRSCWCVHDFEN